MSQHTTVPGGSTPPDHAGLLSTALLEEQQHTPAAERAAGAAGRLGVEAEQVEKLPFDLSVLEDEGLFVNIDARGFGILDRRLDWSALGIKLPRDSAVAFRPPRIGVIPDKYRLPLQRPASQAHAALKRYGFRFRITETLFQTPEYRWVPWQAYSNFEAAFKTAQDNLRVAIDTALEHYDEIIEAVRKTFTELADDSARRLSSTTGQPVEPDFYTRIVEGALSLVPSQADLAGLALRFKPGVILLGSEMLAEQRRAAEERRQLTQAQAETHALEVDMRERERVEQLSLLGEQERQRRQSEFLEEELERERATKERIRRLKVEAARDALSDTLSPLLEGAEQLHLRVFEAAKQMRDTLQGAEFVPGATAKSARELARWFRLMNFQNDGDLAKLLEELGRLASAKKESRRPGDLSSVLGDIERMTQEKAAQALRRNRFDALEV